MRRKYQKGELISDKEMKQLVFIAHNVLPAWNYTIAPSKM
jgi:hypothetical protein